MKNTKNRIITIFAAIGAIAIITAFTSQTEPVKVYEFETVTIVESLIQNGLGRSRMISKTEDVDYREATTIRKEDGKKERLQSADPRRQFRNDWWYVQWCPRIDCKFYRNEGKLGCVSFSLYDVCARIVFE